MRIQPFILGLVLLISNGSGRAENPIDYKVVTKRVEDVVKTRLGDDEVAFIIRSPFGISQATIERTASKWPSKVVVQLHLRGLESLKLTAEPMRIEAAVSSHDGSTRFWLAGHEETPLDRKHPCWFLIRRIESGNKRSNEHPSQDGWFEFTLPATLLESNPPKLTLQWIDYYRS